MVFKFISTRLIRSGRRGGFLLPETLIATAITALLVAVTVSFIHFSGRSFAALFNYVDLSDDNRIAIDRMTRDVRQANRISYFATNYMILEDSDFSYIVYVYSPAQKILIRSKNGATKVLLRECENFNVTMGQRNTVGGSYEVFPAATARTAKVVNVSWVCTRTIFGNRDNSESVQTARIVIRKQGK